MNSKRKVCVLFSGGLDSTYLVYKNLMEGNTVLPYYVELKNNPEKTFMEKNAIKNIIAEFKKNYGDQIKELTIICSFDLYAYHHNISLIQVPFWVFSMGLCQNIECDAWQVAYVIGDCAISYLDEIKNLYKSFGPLLQDDITQLPLEFPLIKTCKVDMMNTLPDIYAQHVFSCERPNIEDSCGECPSCKKYKNLLRDKEFYNPSKFKTLYSFYSQNLLSLKKIYDNFISADDVLNIVEKYHKHYFLSDEEKKLINILMIDPEKINRLNNDESRIKSGDNRDEDFSGLRTDDEFRNEVVVQS